jgi:uncharacterized iron-regulated protein
MYEGTISNFKTARGKDIFINKLMQIKKIDETLRFEIRNDDVVLIGENKDNLHRRCMWLINHIDDEKSCIYVVREC